MDKIIDAKRIEKYFVKVKSRLYDQKQWSKVNLSRNWASNFCSNAGVYCLFHKGQAIYIGETGCLRKRMEDLLNTKNHCVRRSLGAKHFSTLSGCERATSSKSFPNHIEQQLNLWMKTNLKVACVPMLIGRKEFEEWLQAECIDNGFINKRRKRKAG